MNNLSRQSKNHHIITSKYINLFSIFLSLFGSIPVGIEDFCHLITFTVVLSAPTTNCPFISGQGTIFVHMARDVNLYITFRLFSVYKFLIIFVMAHKRRQKCP